MQIQDEVCTYIVNGSGDLGAEWGCQSGTCMTGGGPHFLDGSRKSVGFRGGNSFIVLEFKVKVVVKVRR